jgi:hypothetical protein
MSLPIVSTEKNISFTKTVASSKKLNVHLNFITLSTINSLPKMVLHAEIQHRTNTPACCHNAVTGRSEKNGLQMYKQWQGMPTVRCGGLTRQLEMPMTFPDTKNKQLLFMTLDLKNNVTVQEMQQPKNAFN